MWDDDGGFVHSLLKCDKISIMKGVWIAIMLGSMGGFFITLIKGADSLNQGDTAWGVIFWGLSLLVALFGYFAFRMASIYGKAEDNWKMPKG